MGCLRISLIAAGLTLGTAHAEPARVQLSYNVYFTGLDVADLSASFAFAPQSYSAAIAFRMTGALGALYHAEGSSSVDGRFQGDTTQPHALNSSGQFGGKARVTQIGWHNATPVIERMEPPLEPEREPVPVAEQAHTIDSLSAMATLLHRVWQTGRCESDARTYDGRWLSRIEVRTAAEEVLAPTSRSIFSGPALRCELEGHQLAGFWRDTDPATLHRPHRASVWFARTAPGGPLLPVRISVETRGGFGPVVLYLTGAV